MSFAQMLLVALVLMGAFNLVTMICAIVLVVRQDKIIAYLREARAQRKNKPQRKERMLEKSRDAFPQKSRDP